MGFISVLEAQASYLAKIALGFVRNPQVLTSSRTVRSIHWPEVYGVRGEIMTPQPSINYDTLPAGQELDALVAERVTKVEPRRVAFATRDGGQSAAFWEDREGFTTKRDVAEWAQKHDHQVSEWLEYPRYSEDIAAAFQVVENLKADGWRFVLSSREAYTELWWCGFERPAHWESNQSQVGKATAETAPLSVCRAALKAVSV
jgi:hypothetical protein